MEMDRVDTDGDMPAPSLRFRRYVYHKASQTMKEVQVQVPVKASVETEKAVEQKKGLSFLLLGVDQRKNETGRSDTIIVVTIDPKTNKSQMISIPRDLKTEIIGNGSNDKINHAYAFGGPQMALDTVSHLLDIRLDYFAEINLEGSRISLMPSMVSPSRTISISHIMRCNFQKGNCR